MQYNIFEAKSHLSELIAKLEKHEEEKIIIARNNIPIAKLVLLENDEKKYEGK